MLHAPVNETRFQNGQNRQPQILLPERERHPLSVETPGHPSLTENGRGSSQPSAAARSRRAAGSLQRLYGNQAVLQMRNGSGSLPAPSMPLRPSQSGILQRKCACGGAAGMSGECAECSEKKRLGLQTKLKVNEPGDIYEQEADRVADQVLATPAHPAVSGALPRIQRLAGQPTGQVDAAPATVDQTLASPGRPLESALRQDMEQRFGYDFSRVRVHTDENAETSARMINAHAYTVGNDIVFGLGRFDSNATKGRHLLAHELTHVVQQSAGHAPRAVVRQPAKAPPKAPKCDTGCAGHWGQDTTCSKFGFKVGEHEHAPHYVYRGGKGKKVKDLLIPCCNSWPFSLEKYARNQLGLDGAASCTSKHQEEIATVTAGENSVKVLCSDTICENSDKCNTSFGETGDSKACSEGTFSKEVIELSPNAMQKLSSSHSQVATLLVSVCYSGAKQDLCPHNGPGKALFPEIEHCLTEGCTPEDGTPKLRDTGWPRS